MNNTKLAHLKPYENNQHKYSKLHVGKIAVVIECFGFMALILIDDKNDIFEWHNYYLTTKELQNIYKIGMKNELF